MKTPVKIKIRPTAKRHVIISFMNNMENKVEKNGSKYKKDADLTGPRFEMTRPHAQ